MFMFPVCEAKTDLMSQASVPAGERNESFCVCRPPQPSRGAGDHSQAVLSAPWVGTLHTGCH